MDPVFFDCGGPRIEVRVSGGLNIRSENSVQISLSILMYTLFLITGVDLAFLLLKGPRVWGLGKWRT